MDNIAIPKLDENKKNSFSSKNNSLLSFTITFHLPAEAEVCRSANSVGHCCCFYSPQE